MKISIIILFTLTILILQDPTRAQITIKGKITDSELNPIKNALVEIIDENDTANYYSTITNESGNFLISNISDADIRKFSLPNDYIVLKNYPNPFNPSTIIYYELPKSEKIEIRIYDILGRQVCTLYNNFQKAGVYTIEWDGTNNWNSPVSAGVYFCRLNTMDNFKVHKMVLLDGGYTSPPISISKLNNNESSELTKVKSVFNFSIKVSGDNILMTEFNYLSCFSDTTLNLVVPKVLLDVTVGPEGGILEFHNFSLIIPSSAFNSEYTIKLFEKPDNEWSDGTASPIWGIEGLPSDFNIPLDINITPNIELTGQSYITVGQEYEIPYLNSSEIVYNFLETNDTLGYLKAYLFSETNSTTKQSAIKKLQNYNQNKIYFNAKTGFYSDLSHKKHFKIFVHNDVPQDYYFVTNSVGNLFEHNFDLVKATGFDTVAIKWPVEVYVTRLKDDLYKRGCIYYPTYGFKNMSLLVDQRRIDGIIQSSIREYAIGVARSYDKNFFLPNEFTGKVNPERYWFHHALASWFEEKTWNPNNDLEFKPIDYNKAIYHFPGEGCGDNTISPFLGMREGAGTNSRSALKHGGGMSTFIKYLYDNYGEAPILNIYQLIRTYDSHPINAVKNTLSNSYDWWPDYLEQLINDKLYDFFKTQYFQYWDGNQDGIFEDGYSFNDKEDTLKVFDNIQLTSLSAKAFNIDLNSSNIDMDRIIDISQNNNDNMLFVYGGTSRDNYSLLGKSVIFKMKIKELLNTKIDEDFIDHIVIIVTNAECESPYTNKTNSSLKVLLKKKEVLKFNHCKIRLRVCATQSPSNVYWDPSWYTDGSFNDYIFTGTINKGLQGGNATGQIEVILDIYHNIKSLTVMAYDDTYGTLQWGMTASDLTPATDIDYGIDYKYYGNAVCNYVTSRYSKATDPDGNTDEATEFSCDENSLLEITFSYW